MHNIWLVIKHDIGVVLRQRSFWVLAFVMPVILILSQGYMLLQDNASGDSGAREAGEPAEFELPTVGVVDQAGLIANIPTDLSAVFVRMPDAAAAASALQAGEIDQYLVVPADYVSTGDLEIYTENFQLFGDGPEAGIAPNSSNHWMLQSLLSYNLVRDPDLATAVQSPLATVRVEVLAPPEEGDEGQGAMAALVAGILPYVYYFLLIMGSSYLMRVVVAEKENRTAEMLLMRVNPREMMIGKIVAMSVVTLIQFVIWIAGGLLFLDRGAALLGGASFTLPPIFVVWALLFLIFGYLLFAAVMAMAGTLSNDARQGGQMVWLLIIPLMPTLMFAQAFVEEPNSPLVVGLSLFPFSAPTAMVTRMAVADVPTWQILISLAGVALTSYLFILLAARFFSAGNLLSGEAFSWRRLAAGWRQT
ncbi:MAG: ABC transporter permease [Anaerolineae bacterium]|nr:ABC transporter permease [Anaerolineae bacterium]